MEKDLERKVCHFAIATGWLVYKFVSPNRRGVPDRLLAKKGYVLFIEFKQPGKRPTKLQQYHIDKLRDAGLDCRVIDSLESGLNLLENLNATLDATTYCPAQGYSQTH